MSSLLADLRRPFSNWLRKAVVEESEDKRPDFSSEEVAALSCQCHLDFQPQRPHFLCQGCRRFVDECHWIQMYKLPEAQFSKLSKRQMKRGAYIMDGDAREGLTWDYNHMLQDSSIECHLCELLKAAMERSLEDLDFRDLKRARPVQISVYYAQKEKGYARLDVGTLNSDDASYSGSLTIYKSRKWIKI
jgi:hypothetical protein